MKLVLDEGRVAVIASDYDFQGTDLIFVSATELSKITALVVVVVF